MRAKADLIPDCDVHGEPMFLDECPAPALGLEGSRDMIVWRCSRHGCRRYFYGTVGYRDSPPAANIAIPTPRCERDGAFLVVQDALGSSICPVAGCGTVLALPASNEPASARTSDVENSSFALG